MLAALNRRKEQRKYSVFLKNTRRNFSEKKEKITKVARKSVWKYKKVARKNVLVL